MLDPRSRNPQLTPPPVDLVKPRLWLLILIAYWSAQSPVLAQSSNLVLNNQFDDDLAGWTAVGAWIHNPVERSPFSRPGAAEVTSTGAGSSSLSQCIDVSDWPVGRTLTLAGFAQPVNHSSPITVTAEVFSDPSCGASLGISASQGLDAPPLGDWNGYYAPLPKPAAAGSYRVTLDVASGGAGETTRFDDIGLRPDLIVDGDFSTALDSWVQTPPDSWALSDDGVSRPMGSAEATVSADGSAFLSQCLQLSDVVPTSRFLAWVRVLAVDELADYQTSYQFWDNDTCAPPGQFLSASGLLTRPNSVGHWNFFFRFVDVPAGARSVAVFMALNPGGGTPGTRFRVDDLTFQTTETMFRDGFETGNLVAWSSSVQ